MLCDTVFLRRAIRFLVTANVVPSSPIVTLMIEVIRSFETSVLTRVTRRNIPEYNTFLSYHPENFESFIFFYNTDILLGGKQAYPYVSVSTTKVAAMELEHSLSSGNSDT
jgi:hypothetical protein